jgi:hypothetical protein
MKHKISFERWPPLLKVVVSDCITFESLDGSVKFSLFLMKNGTRYNYKPIYIK